jgi:Phage portal protein, SPP1 Gp6-like.
MLFGERPKFVCESPETQAELDRLRKVGKLDSRLMEAAEAASALSGTYLKVAWDRDVYPVPFVEPVDPRRAIPVFKHGELVQVTFWQCVAKDDDKVYRLLELHEKGYIYNGLYLGTNDKLGVQVPLSSLSVTADYPEETETIPGYLSAVYIPNMRPSRCWGSNTLYAPLGRSDYAGVEQLFDSLDEAYTSWMRDLRLGKARAFIPSSYLNAAGPGQGASFNQDQEYFQQVESLGENGLQIEFNQPSIRFEAHKATCDSLVKQALRSCGFSPSTLSETTTTNNASNQVTATEVNARERMTLVTREKKTNYWKDGLSYILGVLLAIDVKYFGARVAPEAPRVEFSPVVKEQPSILANTVKAIADAGAASTETKVRMLHPDWTPREVQDEVTRVQGETGAPLGAVTEPPDQLP